MLLGLASLVNLTKLLYSIGVHIHILKEAKKSTLFNCGSTFTFHVTDYRSCLLYISVRPLCSYRQPTSERDQEACEERFYSRRFRIISKMVILLMPPAHDFPQSIGTNSGPEPSYRPWFPVSKPLYTRCTWSSPRCVPWRWNTGDNELTNSGIFHMDFTYDAPSSSTQLQFYKTRRQKVTLLKELILPQDVKRYRPFTKTERLIVIFTGACS
jgi:hypothetical protein